jgi:ribosome-interacting GTPase 1
MPSVVQSADAALLLADPSTPGVLAGVEEVIERMGGIHVPLVGSYPEDSDPRDLPLPTMLVISKADRASAEDMEVLEELYAERFPCVRFSSRGRIGFQALKVALWRMLGLVRVYTKPPGKKVERSDPFVLPVGATVLDLAGRIHAELPDKLVHARVWGGRIEGQRVAREFELRDRDVVELAT